MSIALLITHAFVNFLAVHDTKQLKFKVKNNLSPIWYLEYKNTL